MEEMVFQWSVDAPSLDVVWVGPDRVMDAITRSHNRPLTAFYVPSSVVSVTGGEGIVVVGNDIRINIDDLPSA